MIHETGVDHSMHRFRSSWGNVVDCEGILMLNRYSYIAIMTGPIIYMWFREWRNAVGIDRIILDFFGLFIVFIIATCIYLLATEERHDA